MAIRSSCWASICFRKQRPEETDWFLSKRVEVFGESVSIHVMHESLFWVESAFDLSSADCSMLAVSKKYKISIANKLELTWIAKTDNCRGSNDV